MGSHWAVECCTVGANPNPNPNPNPKPKLTLTLTMPENPHFTTKVASQVQALDGLLLSSEANVALHGQKG